MGDRQPTVRARELGKGLRRLMERAGLDGTAAVRRLQWDQSKVSRLLSGKGTLNPEDILLFLGLVQAPAAERQRLMQLCREAGKPGWWAQEVCSPEGPEFRSFVERESSGAHVTNWQLNVIPGLLQIPEYMRALFAVRPERSPR